MREKGQVAQSKEIASLAVLFSASAALIAFIPTMGIELINFMKEVFQTWIATKPDLQDPEKLSAFLMVSLKLLASLGLPVAVVGFIAGIVSHLAQIGWVFSFDPLMPSFDKINPLKGFQRIFSGQHFFDSLRVILKVAVILTTLYVILKTEFLQSPQLIFRSPVQAFSAISDGAKTMLYATGMILVIFAAADLWMQKREYAKKTHLTKQEAKQEAKEHEGDPMLKAKVKAIQREASRKRMMQAVKKADVIITNPTHIAIALVYDRGKHVAPRVVAKGADFLAQRIKQVAGDAGVPLVENVPLARALYKSVKIGQTIPKALYQAVAEVLAYVYRLKNRRFE
jgi:flagellar biosynthesis protein FlhB